MTLGIETVVIDAVEPKVVAGFWAELLGWSRAAGDPGEFTVEPNGGSGPTLLVVPVPEGKQGKNRIHLDLRPDDQASEVARAEALGARRVSVGQVDESWVVLADPEGNEFCILEDRPA